MALEKEKLLDFAVFFGGMNLEEELSIGPTIICGFLYFKSTIDRNVLQATLRERLMKIRRFRSRPVKEGKAYMLQEMELDKVPMDKMVIDVTDVKTPAQVSTFVSALNKTPMSLDLPMWRAYIINSMADGRNCILFAIDHMIADGVSLVDILFSMLDPSNSTGSIKPPAPGSRKNSGPSCFTGIKTCLGACFNVTIGDQLPADTKTRLKVKDHRQMKHTDKLLATSPSVDVARLKAVKNRIPGATVNDLLMTALTVCLRMYYEKYEPKVLETQPKVRGNFPISLRGVDKKYKDAPLAYNAFSQGQLRFPIHLEDPKAVYQNIKAQLDVVKISPEPIMRDRLLAGLAAMFPRCPQPIANLVLDQFGKVTAMLSNVLGPTEQVNFMGKPLDEMSFYVLAPIGLYFGLITYNGKCNASICIDGTAEESDAIKLASLFPEAVRRIEQSL